MAIFPNTWSTNNAHIDTNLQNLDNTVEKCFLSHLDANLHANDSVDEEQHGYQKSNIWQSLQAKERKEVVKD